MSHSTRVRGLKYVYREREERQVHVALYTSAWIEITAWDMRRLVYHVALYTSAWIEIATSQKRPLETSTSHSTRVRGLKSKRRLDPGYHLPGRTLHECVD